jgi:cysteine-rich repeat protein
MKLRTVALASLLAGCNVFDAQLYLQRDAGVDATALSPLVLSDRCSNAATLVTRSSGEYAIDTRTLRDDLSDLAACTGRALPGQDGFFRVRMNPNELWHFHVKVLDGASNPALYVLPADCDTRSCAAGLDECSAGRDEHLSFRADPTLPGAQEFLIGVDSAQPGGARYELTVLRATCGDGVREHGESCDDRNLTPGDGCDALCRAELGDNATEREPNDDFSDPNMIVVPDGAGAVTVQGTLGGRCDFDMYGIALPAGGSVQATMLDVNGRPCEADAPEFRMAWVLPNGRTRGGDGAVTTENRCPAIGPGAGFAQRVAAAGTYHVRVSTAGDLAAPVPYRLRFEVQRP